MSELLYIYMSYEIRTYNEEYVEEQANLGTKATENWTAFGQTPAEQLKQTYSQEGFDPTTKFYAFKGDEMVGFLTSTIQTDEDGTKNATVRLPIFKEGHKEASYQLTESFLKMAEERNVKKVSAGVKDDWGNFMEILDKFDFQFERNTTFMARMEVDKISVDPIEHDYEIQELDTDADGEALMDIYMNSFGLTPEQAKANLDAIAGFDKELIIGHPMIKKDGKIIARAWCQKVPGDEETAYFGNIYAPEDFGKFSTILMEHLIKKIKSMGLVKVQKTLTPNEVREDYEAIGFEFDHVFMNYIKEL